MLRISLINVQNDVSHFMSHTINICSLPNTKYAHPKYLPPPPHNMSI